MTEAPDAVGYGNALKGIGLNLLVSDVGAMVAFLTQVFGLDVRYGDEDFAIIAHDGDEFMLHADGTYGEHPLLSLTGDGAIRGAGIEIRFYGVDPDQAASRAKAAGGTILQPPTDKPHGLREAFLVGPNGYVFVPGVAIAALD